MAIDWDGEVLGPVMDVFGESATWSPASGGSYAITGVFDRAYQELTLLDDGSSSNTTRPVLGVRLSQFAAPPAVNDQVTVTSVGLTFIVRDVRPDGHGWAKLMLNR